MKVFEPYFTDDSKETAIDLSISPIKAVGVAPQYSRLGKRFFW